MSCRSCAPPASSRGRPRWALCPGAPLLYLVSLVLRPAAHPSYMRALDPAAHCVLLLRCAHLPGDNQLEARACCVADVCGDCGAEVLTAQDCAYSASLAARFHCVASMACPQRSPA